MSEREIRKVLKQFCDDLDLKTRKNARRAVVPIMMGAGLLVANCDDESSSAEPLYSAPSGSPTATTTGSTGGGGSTPTGTTTGSGGTGGEGAGGSVGGAGGTGGAVGGGAGAGGDPGVDYMAPDP